MHEFENKRVQEAAYIREMAHTQGFMILKSKFEEKIQKATARLLDMSTKDDEINEIRKKIFIWTELTNMMKALIISGDYTAKLLADDFESQSLGFRTEQGDTK